MKKLSNPRIALVRSGSACKRDSDPQLAKDWLAERYELQADFHARTQEWLTAEERAAILLEFMLDDAYDVLWSFRGGEGTSDILPYLEVQAKKIQKAKPKLLIGFSDHIALLNYMNQRFSWPVVHGPGIMQLVNDQIDQLSIQTVISVIHDPESPLEIQALQPLNKAAQVSGKISAHVCGGNLSVLAISIKDIWEIKPAGKILIIEDVDERAHKVIRYLNYFKRIGIFDGVKAVVFGEFSYHNEQEAQALMRTLKRFADSCDFPVLQTHAFGHGKTNISLPFFRKTELSLGDAPILVFSA